MKNLYFLIIYLVVAGNLFGEDLNKMLDSTQGLILNSKINEARELSYKVYEEVIYQNLQKTDIGIRAINNLTSVYYGLRNFDSALYYQELAYDILKEQNSPMICEISQNIGDIYTKTRNFDKADFFFKEAIKYSQEFENFPNLIWSYIQYGTMNFHAGQYDLTLENYTKAYELAKQKLERTHDYYTQALNSLAVYNYNFSKFKDAENYFKELLSIYNSMENIPQTKMLGSLNGYAATCLELGYYQEAEENFLKSLELSRELIKRDEEALAQRIHNVGYFYSKKGDLKLSLEHYLEAYEMRKRIFNTDNPALSNSLSNIGTIYMSLEDSANTFYYFQSDLEMNRRLAKNDNFDYLRSLINMGNFYRFHDKFDFAYPLYSEAKDMAKRMKLDNNPNYAEILINIGILFLRDNKEKDAQSYFDDALAINRNFYNEHSDKLIKNLFMSANYYFTVKNYENVDSLITEAIGNSNYVIDNNIDYFTENEKDLFLKKLDIINYLYFNLISKTYKNNPELITKAFDYRLYRKGYLFNNSKNLKDLVLKANDSTIINDYNNWKENKEYYSKLISLSKNQISSMKIDIEKLVNDINSQEKKLMKNLKEFEGNVSKIKYGFSDIKSKLNKNEAAIEILRILVHGKENDSAFYMAMIVRSDSKYPEIVIIENGWDLEDKYSKIYKEELINDNNSKESYNNYWSEISKKLNGIKKIYFSPDGIYHQINIAALKNPKNGKYLDEELDIEILGNLKDMIKDEDYSSEPFVALFGNPDFDYLNIQNSDKFISISDLRINKSIDSLSRSGISLTPLPSSADEINEIEKLFKKEKISVSKYSSKEATEDNIKKLQNPTVLHLATHGYFLKDYNDNTFNGIDKNISENPLMKSMLFFTGSKNSLDKNNTNSNVRMNEDGILTAYEAQNLNLKNTELVVLAACETGLGEIRNGEGVYGLQRAFQQAGAKSVMMSLWKINDKATKEMMVSFYKNWLSGKSRNEAFKLAKKEIKKKYKYPYYWAGFVLIGHE